MKQFLLAFAIATLTTSAFADSTQPQPVQPTKFFCSGVNGVDEWTIYVDLDKKLAGFFDNDTTVVVELKDVMVLESHPVQIFYTFEGLDAYGDNEVLRIGFNETRLTAHVTFAADTNNAVTHEALDGCIADDDIDLERN